MRANVLAMTVLLVFALGAQAQEEFVIIDVQGKVHGKYNGFDAKGLSYLMIRVVSKGELYYVAIHETDVANKYLRTGKLIEGQPIRAKGTKDKKRINGLRISVILPIENKRFITFPKHRK